MINTSRNHIVAYVSPRSIGGTSIFAPFATIGADSVARFYSEKAVERSAVGKLESMGFTVEHVSKLSIRISGPASLYQARMGVKLERDHSAMYLPTPDSVMNALDLGSEVLEGAAFPQPVEWHATAKAPAKKSAAKKVPAKKTLAAGPAASAPPLSYFHLKVPHDISRIMNADAEHAAGNLGQGVKAAMIDSGFAWEHPYFRNKGYLLSATAPNDQDDNGHGTGESANLLAVAPKVKLHGLKLDDAVAAFQQARDVLKVQIISNSWGSRLPTDGQFGTWDPYWSLVLAEIGQCVQAGIVVLFSGGNGGMSATASSPDVISVGGVYSSQDGGLQASDYASSFQSFRFPGRQVPDVCGLCGMQPAATYIALPIPPGSVLDKSLGGGSYPQNDTTGKTDGWGVFSGTSAACPMVAGVVALMLSKHSELTVDQVRTRLANSCRDVTAGRSAMGDAASPGRDLATGFGLVDAVVACA